MWFQGSYGPYEEIMTWWCLISVAGKPSPRYRHQSWAWRVARGSEKSLWTEAKQERVQRPETGMVLLRSVSIPWLEPGRPGAGAFRESGGDWVPLGVGTVKGSELVVTWPKFCLRRVILAILTSQAEPRHKSWLLSSFLSWILIRNQRAYFHSRSLF